MPRRLGDDPLARARDERANAVATDPAAQQRASQLSVQARSHAPYNDVFFLRRDGEAQAASVGTQESPEISEISEIPEMREVAAAPNQATPATAATDGNPPPTTIAEALAAMNSPVTAPAAQPVTVHEVGDLPQERPAPTSSRPGDEKSEPQNNGGV